MASKKDNVDVLIRWLINVHSMEKALVNQLENQAYRASVFPEIEKRLQEHREESLKHANMVEGCIRRLGGDVSQVRTGFTQLFSQVQSKLMGLYGDSVVRDAITGSMMEEAEIASYRSIIALADQLGDDETVRVCKKILKEEEAMFEFFKDHLSELVTESYERDLLV